MADARNPISLVIIDDNVRSLEFIATALAGDGVQIFTAANPEEGLDLVYTHRPQIVLTDLVMPNMTGLEVLERITEFDPAIDVVLMTAHYTTETAVEAIRKGAADYLNKPISLAVLRERVGRVIETALQRQHIIQAKLLRVLQNQEVQRVGSLTPQKVELRVVAATNKDLRKAIVEHQFREDLYYRLSMVEIHTPSLAERMEDLPLLARHFVAKFAQ